MSVACVCLLFIYTLNVMRPSFSENMIQSNFNTSIDKNDYRLEWVWVRIENNTWHLELHWEKKRETYVESTTLTNTLQTTTLSTTDPGNLPCPIDHQLVGEIEIVWSSDSPGEFLSSPPCLDEKQEFIRRRCENNGTWNAYPNCISVQKTITRCPSNYKLYHSLKGDFCYFITFPQKFPPACPSPSTVSYLQYKPIIERTITSFWVPVQRNITNSFGAMEWIDVDIHHGQLFTDSYMYTSPISERDCLIYQNFRYKAVNCNSMQSAICAYYTLDSLQNSYCSLSYKNFTCVDSEFDKSVSKCICMEGTQDQRPRNLFCNKLAELKFPYQNALSDKFNKDCWIGLKKNNEGFYHWVSSQELVQYTFWSDIVNFGGQYGSAFKSDGWILHEDSDNLTCALCEEPMLPISPVELTLLPDVDPGILLLQIVNPNVLVRGVDNNVLVSCTSASIFTQSPLIPKSSSDNLATFQWNVLADGPGYYQCRGFTYHVHRLVESNILYISEGNGAFGKEYILEIYLYYPNGTDPTSYQLLRNVTTLLGTFISENQNLFNIFTNMRWMKTIGIDEPRLIMQHLFHFTTKVIPAASDEELRWICSNLSESFSARNEIFGVGKCSSSFYCPTSKTNISGVEQNWPLTLYGATALSKELCLRDDNTPLTRTCGGDFLHGAKWNDVNGTCYNNAPKSILTDTLFDILIGNSTFEEISKNLIEITQNFLNALTVDVYFLAKILEKYASEDSAIKLEAFVKIVSNTVKASKDVLKESQQILNSTDTILYNFDLAATSSAFRQKEGFAEFNSENIFLLTADLITTNVSGLALQKSENGSLIANILYTNMSFEEVMHLSNLKVAVYLPGELRNQIISSANASQKPTLIITLFYDDSLFNENETETRQSGSHIVSVLIPNFSKSFNISIPVIFKPFNNTNQNKSCAHWNYGSGEHFEAIQGSWFKDSGNLRNSSDLVICEFSHITHLGLLMMGDLTEEEIKEANANAVVLESLTIIGYSFSCLGILGIFVTGILFHSWRSNPGNQILINFAIAMSLQIFLLYLSYYLYQIQVDIFVCVTIAILLNYTVLSEFSWMLVIGILQFKKFVQVLIGPPKWLLLKACLIGWGLPLIPIAILLPIYRTDYIDGSIALCYPGKFTFYYGVTIPIGIIMAINFTIFVKVIINICSLKSDAYGSTNVRLSQIRLAILLFFLLGLSWIFGILSEFGSVIIFMYLFCLTAPFQGFIMFLFFVVFNKNTRRLYMNLLKIKRSGSFSQKHTDNFIIK